MHRRQFLKATTAATAFVPLASSTSFSQTSKSSPPQTVKAVRDRIKPITKEERLARQDKARELMARLGIDALFFEGGTSLNYFTGISWGRSEHLFTMILPRNGEPQYVAPKFEADRATEQVGKAKLLTWEEDESPYEFIKQILKEKNILTGTPGIEETTRFFVTDRITKEIGTTKLVNGKPDDW